ncbi:MAG: hypothetical protein LBK61_01610 [Spirochaetaceae bacterium]|nr:hypothetical protein [Spirochaetaceae bacterium]
MNSTNKKKAGRFFPALVIGCVALLAGCDALTGFFGGEEEVCPPENHPEDGLNPSVLSFYVSSTGDDTNNEGTDEAAPLATLAVAYEKALLDKTRRRIVVLTDLVEEELVTLPPNGITTNVKGAFVLIEGKSAGLKIERSVGANDSVLQIQGGAKVAFKNITVNGKIAPNDDSENANNRAILVTGNGTEVVLGAGAVATGKMYSGDVNIDSDKHGIGIRVINGGKLVMAAGSAVTDCEGVQSVNGAIQLSNGFLEMKYGSRVYGNTARFGGGVQAYNDSAVTMYGGEISGNRATQGGGGIHLQYNSAFTMLGGEIIGNEAIGYGGGIGTGNQCAVTIKGGKITGNRSEKGGGGVEVFKTAFTMAGGEIGGNTTDEDGGGVYLSNDNTTVFTMTGGVVYGADVPVPQGNTVDAGAGKTGAALYKSADAVIKDTPSVTDTTETTIDMR